MEVRGIGAIQWTATVMDFFRLVVSVLDIARTQPDAIAMAEVELNSRLRLLTVDLKGEIMSVRVLGEPREDSKT